jgi:AraC-like DNA-binding protein
MGTRLQKVTLGHADGFAVLDVRCTPADEGWSEAEPCTGYWLIFPRRGVFLRRVGRRQTLLDPGSAYFELPDLPQQVAHPYPGGDVCTAFSLPAAFVAQLTGGEPCLPEGPVFTDGAVDLAQRTLVARLRSGLWGDFEATEQVIRLTADVLEQWCPEQIRHGRPSTARDRRSLIDRARARLAADPRSTRLAGLARTLGVSPHHLSRVFHEETGQTLARHRNRLRVRLALERIGGGEVDLAGLAADLGFSDQAHLTRTMRREVGHPPAHVRRLLAETP